MIQGMISAWITTEYGLALPELDVKHAEGRVDCWIPSIQGTNFCINWHSLNPSSFGLRGDIWLDGVAVGGGLLMPNETRGIKMTGHSTGNASERPYHFGKQQLTDDDTVSSPDDPRLAELNTIRLVLDWVYVTEERQSHLSNTPASLGPIHEKAAKKAHGDSAGLGAPRPSTTRQWFTTQSIGMKKTVVVFHYAPEDWLLAKKIIAAPLNLKLQPTSRPLHSYLAKPEKDKKRQVPDRVDWFGPSSSGSSSSSALSQSTPGRSIQLPMPPANRKRARRTETPELRIYDGDEDSVEEILAGSSPTKRPRNEVKYETFNHPVGSFVNGEVIDLTGDDSD